MSIAGPRGGPPPGPVLFFTWLTSRTWFTSVMSKPYCYGSNQRVWWGKENNVFTTVISFSCLIPLTWTTRMSSHFLCLTVENFNSKHQRQKIIKGLNIKHCKTGYYGIFPHEWSWMKLDVLHVWKKKFQIYKKQKSNQAKTKKSL